MQNNQAVCITLIIICVLLAMGQLRHLHQPPVMLANGAILTTLLIADELHPHDEEAMFALKHSQDLVTAGSISLVQRQPSTLNPLGTQASSSSLEVPPTQHRGSLDQSLPTSGSVDSRLPRKNWVL